MNLRNLKASNVEDGKLNLRKLSDKELISKVTSLVRQERQIIEDLIWHLQEIQDRKLFISLGYTSLHDCLVKHFGYSGAAAYAKLSALKIISAVPEAAAALNKGEVTLTTLSLAQSFVRKQEQQSGSKVSNEEKVELLEVIKNKTTQEVKQTLAELNPALELPHDKVNYLTRKDVQLVITTDKELLEKIAKVKSLVSHEDVDPSYSKLLHMAFDALIEKKEKSKGFKVVEFKEGPSKIKAQSERSIPTDQTGLGSVVTQCESIKSEGYVEVERPVKDDVPNCVSGERTRMISRSVKRKVLARSEGRCEFVHANGRRCDSAFQLQFDHVVAFSKGGNSEFGNIQNLCRIHNNYKGNGSLSTV